MGGTANTTVHPDLSEGPVPAAVNTLMTAHAADVAEWLNALDPARAAELLSELPLEHAVRVIEQPEFEQRARLFRHLHTPAAVDIFKAMSPDQQADLVRELHDADRAGLLVSMDRARRRELEVLLAYPLATAGSLMTTDYLSVPMTWTAGQTLDRIRTSGSAPRPVYAIYVVDPEDNRLVHVVSLRELVMAAPTAAAAGS
jgi:magnesium transporter